MAENLWNKPGVPHRGWKLLDVVDLRAGCEAIEEPEYAVCQMCGNEKIRYIHIMAHPEYKIPLEVGCICAEKMSGDYKTHKRMEAELRKRAAKRKRWLTRKWRISAKGNEYLKLEGYHMVVFPLRRGGWCCTIDGEFSSKTFKTSDEAKLALFDKFYALSGNEKLRKPENYEWC